MIAVRPIADRRASSPLGRASPLSKLVVALGWLIALALTTRPEPPLMVVVVALLAGLGFGGIRPHELVRTLAPLWLVALVVVLSNSVFGAANADPSAPVLVHLGPLRLTGPAVATAFGVGLRVVAIASVGAVFALTTDSTRLVDSLVQQARVPERFGYGALAAYQAIPRFAEDLTTLRQARRIRGLGGDRHPRLLLGLLVLAIRHGDRLALAMDARGFGSGPRSRYRIVRWTAVDLVVAVVGASVIGALVVASGG